MFGLWRHRKGESRGNQNSNRAGAVGRSFPTFEVLEDRCVPAIFTVTSLADAGAGSLRDAIAQANAAAGADDIVFDQSLVNGTVTLTSGQLSITESLTVTGLGAPLTSISGNSASRIFNIAAGAGSVTLAGLTMTNGRASDALSPASHGGAIFITSGTVTIRDSILTANSTFGPADGDGGAIFHATGAGTLTVERCTISGNSSLDDGGGIYINNGTLVVRESTISGNTARDGGGAIDNASGMVTVERSTLSGNSVGGSGGTTSESGGAIRNRFGTTTVINSTISGNTALKFGGGISNNYTGTVTVRNSTLSGNTATTMDGGGISHVADPEIGAATGAGTTNLDSTIIANNTAGVAGPDFRWGGMGAIGATSNLIESAGGHTVNNAVAAPETADMGNIVGSDPALAALADNNGPTSTHALMAGSMAINAGINPLALTTDQRNFVPRVNGGVTDIGSFESGAADGTAPSAAAIGAAPNVTNASPSTMYDFVVRFADNANILVASLGNTDVRVTGPGGFNQLAMFVSSAAGGSNAVRFATYRITPPGGSWDIGDNGTYTISLEAGAVTDSAGAAVAAATLATFNVDRGAGGAALVGGTLTINGSAGSDTVIITQVNATTVNVNVSGADQGNFSVVQQITVDTAAGNDTITVANTPLVPLTINGGDGTDVLDLTGIAPVTVFLGPNPGTSSTFVSIERVTTGAGNDSFVFLPGGDLSAGTLDGGTGQDTLDFSRLDIPIEANLGLGTAGSLTVNNMDLVIGSLFRPLAVTPPSSGFLASFPAHDHDAHDHSPGHTHSSMSDDDRRHFTNGAGSAGEAGAGSEAPSGSESSESGDATSEPAPSEGGTVSLDPALIDELFASL